MANIRTLTLKKLLKKDTDNSALGQFTAALESHLQSSSFSTKAERVGSAFLAVESINAGELAQVDDAVAELQTALESATTIGGSADLKDSQHDAAIMAGALAGNIKQWLKHPVVKSYAAEAFTTNVGMDLTGMQGGSDKRIAAFEAYDERENRSAVLYSMAYNLHASRQNDFGEAFFPTVTVSPDNVGYDISIRLINIFDGDLKRDISGAIDNFQRRNIIRAQIDHTILQTNLTEITPVYRPETQANFVPVATIGSRNVLVGRETVTTAALATGKRISLLGISSVPALIANGLQDASDAVEPAMSLKKAYVKVGADVIGFDVSGLATSNFVGAVQGQHRLMNLNFSTDSLMVNKNTKRVDGSALSTLADVVTDDVIVHLSMNMSGNADLQTSTTEVHGNRVSVVSVKTADGTALSLTGAGAGKDIADLFADAVVIGYDLLAYRTNSNRRQRGDQLDTMYWTQRYAVPVLAPISVARPVGADASTDTSDLGALITTTQVRASNNAVTQLQSVATMLSQYVDERDQSGEPPELLGVGSRLVRPTYIAETLDVSASVDSRTSHERAKDVQSVLVNKLRDMVYRMYINSGFKAAADAMNGGVSKTPTVILGTDQELARYLQIDGDLRTLGPDFDLKVVHSVDNRMKGKIYVAFGYFDGSSSTPNPLHFGNMLWKPEVTMVLPISRNGQISKELTVQPSFLHIVNCPVLGLLEVNGISAIIASKVAVATDII